MYANTSESYRSVFFPGVPPEPAEPEIRLSAREFEVLMRAAMVNKTALLEAEPISSDEWRA